MSVEIQGHVPKRIWRRGARRKLIAAVPVVIWLLAIAATFQLYQRASFVGTVVGFADDQPVTLADLEPGIVRKVHVQLHDLVVHGQMVVTMDDRQERIELRAVEEDSERLRAEVLAEEARLSASNAGAIADVDDLARRFSIDRESAHVDYLSQLVQDAWDRILLRGARVEYDIVRSLHEDGNASLRELNDIQTEMDSLKAVVDENVAVLERKKRAFQEADQRWGSFLEHGDVAIPYEPVLTPLRLAIDVRQRDIEEIVLRIDAHVLRATTDGQVTALLAHAGDRVQAGSPLVTISPTATNLAVAYLPEQMTLSAQVGAPVSVSCLATTGRGRRDYTGVVVSLSATVTEAPLRYRQMPTYPVWGRGMLVALDDDARLIPGESVRIAFSD
ncbi:MAG: HlyD family efflux transporter periplasmic adaptor subunit [Phycisphaerales bacterium]|nr:MAG: HlyD family efflux transporter periplasmic adaptor subunit [Phycisphaerales bacterium]